MAQTESATISGRITDQSGAIMQGVTVQLQSAERGTMQETVTNEAGIYVFASVRPGIYHMNVVKQGFQQVSYPNLIANVQSHIEQNFTLKVGPASESVTVSGHEVRINTQDASVSTLVDPQFVENMPLNGRSFQSLIFSVPGVVINQNVGQTSLGQFDVNGQRPNANYFTVDGVSANLGTTWSVMQGDAAFGTAPIMNAQGGTNGMISVDAMQEFRIQTSNYAPEFGRTPGGQISITSKSGGNQWHGTASDYIRNDFFDARNYFNTVGEPQAKLRQHDFGGTLSGPIWKDHTFFFFSYEGLRLKEPTIGQITNVIEASELAKVPSTPGRYPLLPGFLTTSGPADNASTCGQGTLAACGVSS